MATKKAGALTPGDVLATSNFKTGVLTDPRHRAMRTVKRIKMAAPDVLYVHTEDGLPIPFFPGKVLQLEGVRKGLREWTVSDVQIAMRKAGMTHDADMVLPQLKQLSAANNGNLTLSDLVKVGLATTKPGYSTQTQRELEKMHGPREAVNEGPARPGFEERAAKFLQIVQQKLDAHNRKAYPGFRGNDDKLEFMKGSKYWRIVAVRPGGSRAAWGFLNTETGDVLKSAGWNAPAKGPRGNIFDADNGVGRVGPFGPEYLVGPSYKFREGVSLAKLARAVMTEADQQAYKGYLIKKNPFTGIFYISKDNQHIGSAKSEAEAKQSIDQLMEAAPPKGKEATPRTAHDVLPGEFDRLERDRADYDRQVSQGSKDEAQEPQRRVPGEEPEADVDQRWVPGEEPEDESFTGHAGPEGNTDDILNPSAERMWEKFYAAQERYAKSSGLKSESAAKRAMAFWHRRAVRAEARQLKETRRKRWQDHELHEDEKSAARSDLYEFIFDAEIELDTMATKLTKLLTRLSSVDQANASRLKEIIQPIRAAQERMATLKQRMHD